MSPKDDWWYNVEWILRNYPERKKEYEELHRVSLSASSDMRGSGDVSRSTENIALRQLPPQKQREYDAVTSAIKITALMPDGEKRLELIDRIYWCGKRKYINQVVFPVGVSEATARRWRKKFISLVGEILGYTHS